ncbi:ribonuclease P protein component [Agriterribacter sp.]|uniref:ribonuclease P protein component n=1 Tax=Agriterribacter sp. TaxID=2821509 RepID=UPI002CF11BDB|nr:ribonuclease P protein component [Agriterribacter sp.]HRO44656.1 ribonuclease P protein component [Agriterribacter sp.]HRQ16093.1 ribonuclease P protein component [Agriterribacter sp.]
MKKAFTLSRQERLKSRKRIEQLFREGRSISVFPYRVLYLPVAVADTRLPTALQAGVAVSSKHFKKAVHRNKIKRLTREAYRLQKAGLQQKLIETGKQVMLFFIYTGRELPDFLLVKEKVQVILDKLIRVIDENRSAHT